MPYILPVHICLYACASAICVRIIIVQVYVFRPCSPGINVITASVLSFSVSANNFSAHFYSYHLRLYSLLGMPAQYRYGTTFTARPHTRKQFPRARQTVKLTTQARKAITADQRARRAAFDNDVAKIWQKNMDACEELAVKHKKTLRRCYDAIFLGAKLANGKQKVVSKWKAYVAAMVKQVNAGTILYSVLCTPLIIPADLGPGQKKVNALDVVKTHREQYQETPMDELQQYVQELTESKKEKNYGRRVTAKSKVMDVHHTFEELKGIVCIPVN